MCLAFLFAKSGNPVWARRLLFGEGQFEKGAAVKALAAMTLTAGEGS